MRAPILDPFAWKRLGISAELPLSDRKGLSA